MFGALYPRVAGGTEGGFVVTWQEVSSGDEPFARRLSPLGARSIDVDGVAGPSSNGNGVFEPGETVRVAPSWFNSVERPLSADGQKASSFTGPSGTGVSYTVPDPAAVYGAIAPDATVSCVTTGDCYSVGVTNGHATDTALGRPSCWSRSRSDAHGPAKKRWTLHVGDSFTDVPRTSPFYRFVETLLHPGLTAAAPARPYCPAQCHHARADGRVRAGGEGGAGVRAARLRAPSVPRRAGRSPFCRLIEELARRGVVGGLRRRHYCPADAVTREQMAVFVLRTLDPTLNPPACTTPVFADVPATSPFCRWIEELARRGRGERLRRRQLLPDRAGDARADGRVPHGHVRPRPVRALTRHAPTRSSRRPGPPRTQGLQDAGMYDFPAPRHQRLAGDLVLQIQRQRAVLDEVLEEDGDVARVHLAGVVRDRRGQVQRPRSP